MKKTQLCLEKLDDLEYAQDFVENLLIKYNIDLEVSRTIHLVLDELCLNIFTHCKVSDIKLDITLAIDNLAVKLLFIDNGIAFNPLSHSADPILDLPIEERPIGGLGLHIVKHFADNLDYNYNNNKNCLTFVKYLSK